MQPSPAPTQTRYPWNAVRRTLVAVAGALLALLPLLPVIADTLGVAAVPWVASALVVAAGITRLLATPGVEQWLRRFLPSLAADPHGPTDR